MGTHPFFRESKTDETITFAKNLASICVGRITDRAARCYAALLLHERLYRELIEWDLPKYVTASDYLLLRQVQGFFSKLPDLPLGEDKKLNAEMAFREAEGLCLKTNELFEAVDDGRACFADRRVGAWLFYAQRKISAVLGDLPSFMEVKPRFGPGACAGIPKKKASRKHKFTEGHACSESFAPVLSSALSTVPLLAIRCSQTDGVAVKGSRVAFVPKNAKTDRAVASEPSLNTMFQLGYGDYMSDCLKRFGIDLHDQTRNQRLAREGSITGALATLDLTSASDTVARSLVWSLLPFDWAERLSELRTSSTELDRETIELEKFSSMGNGFTFPLESLIFYALCVAVCGPREVVSVYGDDIIVPTHHYEDVCTLLRICGFVPNLKKSFSTGPFRESCGADWLSGVDVRPFFLKGNISPQRLMVMHNYFVRQYDEEIASIIRSAIPETFRIYGPDGYGDGHLLGDWIPIPKHRELGYGGFVFDTFASVPKRDWRLGPGDRVLPVYSIYLQPPAVPVDDRIRSHKLLLQEYATSLEIDDIVMPRKDPKKEEHDTIFGDTFPGTDRVRRISVYTLTAQ